MEHMQTGNMEAFLLKNDKVDEAQRLRWVHEAAKGVEFLHGADVLQCYINPKNILLDAQLGLKITGFRGSSLAGSKPSACSKQRFSIPDINWRDPPRVQDDIFAFGTAIYFYNSMPISFPSYFGG